MSAYLTALERHMLFLLKQCQNRIAHRSDCNTRKLSYVFFGSSKGCNCGADELEYSGSAGAPGT